MSDAVYILEMKQKPDGQWDGNSFDDFPPWLADTIRSGKMGIVGDSFAQFGHAVWAIKTHAGIKVGQPGDRLTNDTMFGIHVDKNAQNKLVWEDVQPEEAKLEESE